MLEGATIFDANLILSAPGARSLARRGGPTPDASAGRRHFPHQARGGGRWGPLPSGALGGRGAAERSDAHPFAGRGGARRGGHADGGRGVARGGGRFGPKRWSALVGPISSNASAGLGAYFCDGRAELHIPAVAELETCGFHAKRLAGLQFVGGNGGLAAQHKLWVGPGDVGRLTLSGVRLPHWQSLPCLRRNGVLTVARAEASARHRAPIPGGEVCVRVEYFNASWHAQPMRHCARWEVRCPPPGPPRQQLIELKTFKTGGSTMATIVKRFSQNGGLSLIHNECTSAPVTFKCRGPRSWASMFALAQHTISHVPLSRRAWPVCSGLPRNDRSGWLECSRRIAAQLGTSRTCAHRKFFPNATIFTLIRSPADQSASAMEQFSAPTMLGCRRVFNSSAVQSELRIKYVYRWTCPGMGVVDRDGAVRYALNKSALKPKAIKQPYIFHAAAWVLGYHRVRSLWDAGHLSEAHFDTGTEFLARIQLELDFVIQTEDFVNSLLHFGQRNNWTEMDMYYLRKKERVGKLSLQPETRAMLMHRNWFDGLLHEFLLERFRQRQEHPDVRTFQDQLAFLAQHCVWCLHNLGSCWAASPRLPGPGMCNHLGAHNKG